MLLASQNRQTYGTYNDKEGTNKRYCRTDYFIYTTIN